MTFTTMGGNFKAKLEIELDAPSSTSSGLSPSLPATATAPGGGRRRRRRHRGPAAMVKSQARAAAHQAPLASAEVNAPPASSPPCSPRPLHHLLSPSTGRRQVMSLGRPELPTFSSLNLDGTSSPSPTPTPPTPSSASPSPSTPSPSPPVCYRGCTWHCDSCGKCAFLCRDHSGCTCCDEEDLPPHCTVCCCLRDALDCPFAHLQ